MRGLTPHNSQMPVGCACACVHVSVRRCFPRASCSVGLFGWQQSRAAGGCLWEVAVPWPTAEHALPCLSNHIEEERLVHSGPHWTGHVSAGSLSTGCISQQHPLFPWQ